MKNPLCLHCRLVPRYRRGLCHRCYRTPAIREQYPTLGREDGCYGPSASRDMTDAELDALEAEQRANAPPWFLVESPQSRNWRPSETWDRKTGRVRT